MDENKERHLGANGYFTNIKRFRPTTIKLQQNIALLNSIVKKLVTINSEKIDTVEKLEDFELYLSIMIDHHQFLEAELQIPIEKSTATYLNLDKFGVFQQLPQVMKDRINKRITSFATAKEQSKHTTIDFH